MEEHEIEFEFEGLKGLVVGVHGEWVIYGGTKFKREAVTNKLKDVIDEAVEDYFDCIAWNKACVALMALATRWVDNGRSQSHGYYDNNQSI